MESSVCDSDNLLPNESDNTNLNEATPAIAPVLESDVSKDTGCILLDALERDDAISSTTPDKFVEQLDPSTSIMMGLEESGLNAETDADFFAAELSITNVPTEKITENVEDIVQDLENLLGESNDSYRFGRESFDNSKLSESYDEVNSSNVEDLVQQSDLYQVEEANIESASLSSSSFKCDMLPDGGIMTPSNVIDNLSESIPLEMPETTTSEVPADVIDELKDIKVDESVAAVLNLVESTENPENATDVELKDIALEPISMEIAEPAEACTKTDLNITPSYTNEIIEGSENICTNKIFELNTEITEEGCGITEKQNSEAECEMGATHSNENQESETAAAAGASETPDSNEISEKLEEEPPALTNLEQNLTACAEPQQNPVELLLENANIEVKSSSSTHVDNVLMDTEESLPGNCDNAINEGGEECALAELEQAEEQILLPEIEEVDNNVAVVVPELKQQREEEDQEAVVLPEAVEHQDDEQKDDGQVAEAKQDEDLQESPKEIVLLEPKQEEIVLSDGKPHQEQLPSPKSGVDTCEKLEPICEDVMMADDNASADILPINLSADQDNEELCQSVLEESSNRELVQPLTVEVEDPDFNEQPIAEVPPVEKEADKVEEVEEVDQTEVAEVIETNIPVNEPVLSVADESQTNRAPLKMTIAKHKSENVHSILKIYDPNEEPVPKLIIKSTPSSTTSDFQEDSGSTAEEPVIPRITIKPVLTPPESQHSPKLTIKPIKVNQDLGSPRMKSSSSSTGSPRITIKPVVKPEALSPLKLTLRPYPKLEDLPSSPKLNIKPIMKPVEEAGETHHSPKITIKPIIKPPDEGQSYTEERHSPRITIKPIIKPAEEFARSDSENVHSPRITIKPIVKPQEPEQSDDTPTPSVQQPFKLNIKPIVRPAESSLSPKITIKPVPKPEIDSESVELIDFEEQIKQERIVLKIAKNKKDKTSSENEKLKKIKLKFSKEGGTAHIVPQKRSSSEGIEHESKYFRAESTSDLTISLVSNTASITSTPDVTITRVDSMKMDDSNSNVSIENLASNVSSSLSMEELPDPLADIPVFEITLETAAAMSSAPKAMPTAPSTSQAGAPPAPRKRGRPRKVPLEVREEFKDPKEEEVPSPVVEESTRPKRSCRGASVRATLGIKPRKPRAPRGRGGKRTVSTRATAKKSKERKSPAKNKLPKEPMVKEPEFKEFEPKDAEFKQVPLPSESANREVVIYEEETRMSSENSSRAQTPAKQVLVSSTEVIEESQSSVQSNTTTESGEKIQKARKGPRLEVHQEPEGEVISADKLAEYSWGGGGPYMLQEQVAQFLGIKSFKRKYPGIQRRPVDMQERDFIRESCLASEAMCDMGLTAVKSEDILDIMYTDFQNKYEEYCKHQRDRQAKDVSNKQKALSLAASQEKTKLDIVEQAVQSAFQWNANFNKTRREQRRACMDLQTFTVHFPKGKMKQVNKVPIGHYPLALVPGQFTDYYKKYNPFELSNLPLNTIGCKSISSINHDTEESQSDASGSDSDSSSSDSDSSCSGSSGAEDCKMCSPAASSKKLLIH